MLLTCGSIQTYIYRIMNRALRKNNGVWHVLDLQTYEVLSSWPANRKDLAIAALGA